MPLPALTHWPDVILLSSIVLLAGLVLICLSIKRHFSQWFPERKLVRSVAMALRVAGYALVIGATALLIQAEGWGVGLPLLCGIVPVAAFAISMLTTWRANALRAAALARRRRRA
ncbi:MAG: DUF3325 domain-containing protein [Pseudomonadota bacterium]